MSATLTIGTTTTSNATQRLTPSEAEQLWRSWKERRDARSRDRLVLAYAPMVRYIASRKVRELPAHCELDDLASAGLVALMEAIDRFDPVKGASFEQYAWTRVAGALLDELRKQDWASRSVRREGRRIERARDSFFARNGIMPTEAELAVELVAGRTPVGPDGDLAAGQARIAALYRKLGTTRQADLLRFLLRPPGVVFEAAERSRSV